MITMNEYQEKAHETSFGPKIALIKNDPYPVWVGDTRQAAAFIADVSWVHAAFSLGGEVGELQNYLKKILRDREGKITQDDYNHVRGELGGILWYLAEIATNFGLTLEEIAEFNLAQLASRSERGTLAGSGDDR